MKLTFMGLLGILFIALKLTGYITWSWFIVLLPILWPLYALIGMFVVFTVALSGMIIAAAVIEIQDQKCK